MSTLRDYYIVLEVSRDVSDEDIKKAYRKLALKYHPDRNPDDPRAEERFKEATEAYEVLRDEQKRAAYDRFGHAGVRGGGPSAAGPDFGLQDALNAFMRDFGGFSDIFGGSPRGPRDERGSDLQIRVRLTLEEVATGVNKKLKIKKPVPCATCEGSGAEEGSKTVTCPECRGAGQVRQVHRTFIGQFINVATCPRCHGEGRSAERPCPTCAGEGRVRGEETVEVDIPPGVGDDNYLTVRGRGEAGRRGRPAGDLIVIMEVTEHDAFERHGSDLVADLPISPSRAALGGDEEVPTLDGRARISIPSGVQTGKVLRLKGKGLPELNRNGRGDLLLRVLVWVPTKVSGKEKEFYQELEKLESKKSSRPDRGVIDRIREAFRGS